MLQLVIPDEVPEGFDILKAQRDLQFRVVSEHGVRTDHVPGETALTHREVLSAIRWSKEAYDREHVEMLEQLPSKDWKKDHNAAIDKIVADDTRIEIKFEAIDQLHFWLNQAIALGFESWDEIVRWYLAKNKENFARQDRGY